MELRTYLQIINRRKWIIIGATLIAAIVATGMMYVADPIYVATTTLRVATVGGQDGGRPDINYTERLMNTYSQIVRTGSVQRQLVQELGLAERPVLTVNKVVGTELMRIQTESTDPIVAQNVANAAAEILIAKSLELYSDSGQTTKEILEEQISLLESELVTLRSEYEQLLASSDDDAVERLDSVSQSIALKERSYTTLLEQFERVRLSEVGRKNAVSIIEPAQAPSVPAKPKKELNIVLGALLGLFTGIGLALVFENLDRTLYNREQIEAITNLPTVGNIPSAGNKLELVHYGNGHGPQLEAFRRLRINVLAALSGLSSKTMLVTSSEAGEGKSTVTANLAVTIAQSGRRVVVVDCNLHNPQVHTIFGVPNNKGLSDILTKQVDVSDVTLTTQYPRLTVIPCGTHIPNPIELVGSMAITENDFFGQLTQGTELLGSREMENLIVDLQESADVVLLDTPALRSVTDAAMLVPLVDNVILVVARSHSSRDSLRATYEQLQTVNAKAVSLVVNQE